MRIGAVGNVDRRGRGSHARKQRARAHLERVRERRRLATRPRALAVGVVALGIGAGFGDGVAAWLTGMPERRVDVIAVHGTRHLTPSAVASAAAIERGTPIGALDPEQVATSLAAHDWIASARALRLPTGTLVVDVTEREPVATVAIGSARYAVDPEGRPFAELAAAPDPSLPEIVSRTAVTPREVSPGLAEAVRLARRLPELGLAAPARIELAAEGDAEGYALRLAAPDTRVVLGRDDLDGRLEELARLLSLRPDAVAEAREIDVRFAGQLVLRGVPARNGSATTAPGRGRGPARSGRPAG